MSRVEISFPVNVHFSTELPVRISDVNHGNHLGHDRMISMIHEARLRFFKSLGYEELDVEGVGTVIADLAISYRNEAFYGDKLRFDIAVEGISRKSCQFIYRVVRVLPADQEKNTTNGTEKDGEGVKSDELIALAKTGVVFFDYALRKSTAVPAGFIEQLQKWSDR